MAQMVQLQGLVDEVNESNIYNSTESVKNTTNSSYDPMD